MRVPPRFPSRSSAHRLIPASPGRNANMSPSLSRWAAKTHLATSSAGFFRSMSFCAYRNSTGNILPLPSMSGAPSFPQISSVSMVADIIMMRRSGRRILCASRTSARASSEARLLSWNSSNITAETPSRAGSATSILPRMPSVNTSMRVFPEVLFSNLIR